MCSHTPRSKKGNKRWTSGQKLKNSPPQIIYTSLQSVLDSNPFTDDVTEPHGSVDGIIRMLNFSHELMSSYEVNDDIGSQLFSYIFFFINISLFNTVMEQGNLTAMFAVA